MFTIEGKYNFAHVMADSLEESTTEQIKVMLDCPVFQKSQIRIMADAHAGKGSVVGFTSTLGDSIIPNIVGVDGSCGIEAYKIGKKDIDYEKLDLFIRKNIPSGMNSNQKAICSLNIIDSAKDLKENIDKPSSIQLDVLLYMERMCENINWPYLHKMTQKVAPDDKEYFQKVMKSLSSLGNGNHFFEINIDPDGNKWLLIHSGSRNFGLRVCEYWQDKAKNLMKTFYCEDKFKDLEFLPLGMYGDQYLIDMQVVSSYASLNRALMAYQILRFLDVDPFAAENIKTVHNYIGVDKIIRKGAISAKEGEKVLIPINMRDGVIVGTGKGSKKWNYSAPHGAGRIFGRNQAKKTLSLEEFKDTMKDVWTSCVSEKTLDESPMAYKPIDQIVSAIGETVNIDFIMKPVYNFKASE